VVAVIAAVALGACAASPKPHTLPAPDPALAASYSAEITAADTVREVVLTDVGTRHRAGLLTDASFSAIRNAGLRLEAAVRVASSELKVYLASGVAGDGLERALSELRAARTDFELTRDKVNAEDPLHG